MILLYEYSTATSEQVEAAISGFRPYGVGLGEAKFARSVVMASSPVSPGRARSLLWASSRLAAFCSRRGLGIDPAVVLRISSIERFMAESCDYSPSSRRTVRSNLLWLSKQLLNNRPTLASFPRERSTAPYSASEIASYLTLADAQPTVARATRFSALVSLGAGAGIVGPDLRLLRGIHITEEHGAALVSVSGTHARHVPVRTEFKERVLAAACFAGSGFVIGGNEPTRRNLTTRLLDTLSGGEDLERVSSSRLRSTWLVSCANDIGLSTFMAAAGMHTSQRLGDLADYLESWEHPPGDRGANRRVLNNALERSEEVIDRSGIAQTIEDMLPNMGQKRQLSVRTLLLGILLALADDRPCHLTRVHQELVDLREEERVRLGIMKDHHLLTYRQVEHTFRLVRRAVSKDHRDGSPSPILQEVMDHLIEASVPDDCKDLSRSLALDWSDHETFSCPPFAQGARCADDEASWGHRRATPAKTEMFFGYYLTAATMVRDEGSDPVPELIRRMTLTTCHVDPARASVSVLDAMVKDGTPLGDVLVDSGYAHRKPEHFAVPLRSIGASLVMDLHPHDRGPQGTYKGAICNNGSLYCPATPVTLLGLGPLARSATKQDMALHDEQSAELERYRLSRITTDDSDGYHRVTCPAAAGKVRCPAKPKSMMLRYDRPEIASAPDDLPPCCSQATITVAPNVNAKTAQKHPYPSAAHRASFARRTAVERSYSTLKDPASTDVNRGWCRVMGLAAIGLFLSCAVVTRNQRVIDSFEERQRIDDRRAAVGLPPRKRRRRRRTVDDLLQAPQSA